MATRSFRPVGPGGPAFSIPASEPGAILRGCAQAASAPGRRYRPLSRSPAGVPAARLLPPGLRSGALPLLLEVGGPGGVSRDRTRDSRPGSRDARVPKRLVGHPAVLRRQGDGDLAVAGRSDPWLLTAGVAATCVSATGFSCWMEDPGPWTSSAPRRIGNPKRPSAPPDGWTPVTRPPESRGGSVRPLDASSSTSGATLD